MSRGNSWLDVCFASLNTLLLLCCMLEFPRDPHRFIQTYYVYRETLTSLWYNLSQGKLHSLVTLMQELWSSDAGSTSSALWDSEDWIVLPEGGQMVSLFGFSLCLRLITIIWIFGGWLMTLALIQVHSQHLDTVYIYHLLGWMTAPQQLRCN